MLNGVLSGPEPYEGKLSCTVLRGGKCSNALTYPTQRAGVFWKLSAKAPAAGELDRCAPEYGGIYDDFIA